MLSAARMIFIMNSTSLITSTDMVEADVSDGLDQLDEAVSGLISGKLKSSRLHCFKSYSYHTR